MSERRPLLPTALIPDPRIFVTVTLVVIQLSLLSAIALAGGGFFLVHPVELLRYGALARELVWDEHEYWRIASAVFVHAGFFHLVLNAVCLLYFGGRVERALGALRYLLLFAAAGLTGNLASLAWSGALVSVGSSGAIFGIVVVYLMVEVRGPLHWTVVMRRRSSRTLFMLIGVMLAFGFLIPEIDSVAHLCGAATGVLFGYFFLAPTSAASGRSPQRWWAIGIWAGLLVLLAATATRPVVDAAHHVRLGFYYWLRSPYLSLENFGKAERHFAAATVVDPRRAFEALDQLVLRNTRLNRRMADRIQITASLLQLFPIDGRALDHYREAVSRNPSADGYWLLTLLARRFDVADYPAAQAACKEGHKAFPDARSWDLTEAEIHARFRRFDQALKVLDRLDGTTISRTADYWEVAARCRVRRGEWAKADEATSRCLSSPWLHASPGQREMHDLTPMEWRLSVLAKLGRSTEAERLRSALEEGWQHRYRRYGDAAFGLNGIAWFLVTHDGDLDEAARLAAESIERGAATENLDTLAWVEHKRGNHKAAWEAMEQALAINPNAAEYFYHAGAILAALDHSSQAREYLRRAVEPGVDFDAFDEAQRLYENLLQQTETGTGK